MKISIIFFLSNSIPSAVQQQSFLYVVKNNMKHMRLNFCYFGEKLKSERP